MAGGAKLNVALQITGVESVDSAITKILYSVISVTGYLYQQFAVFSAAYPELFNLIIYVIAAYITYRIIRGIVLFFIRWTKTIVKICLVCYIGLLITALYTGETVSELFYGNIYVQNVIRIIHQLKLLSGILYNLYILSRSVKTNSGTQGFAKNGRI